MEPLHTNPNQPLIRVTQDDPAVKLTVDRNEKLTTINEVAIACFPKPEEDRNLNALRDKPDQTDALDVLKNTKIEKTVIQKGDKKGKKEKATYFCTFKVTSAEGTSHVYTLTTRGLSLEKTCQTLQALRHVALHLTDEQVREKMKPGVIIQPQTEFEGMNMAEQHLPNYLDEAGGRVGLRWKDPHDSNWKVVASDDAYGSMPIWVDSTEVGFDWFTHNLEEEVREVGHNSLTEKDFRSWTEAIKAFGKAPLTETKEWLKTGFARIGINTVYAAEAGLLGLLKLPSLMLFGGDTKSALSLGQNQMLSRYTLTPAIKKAGPYLASMAEGMGITIQAGIFTHSDRVQQMVQVFDEIHKFEEEKTPVLQDVKLP